MIAMRNKVRFPPSWPAFLMLFLYYVACPSAKAEAGKLFESTNLWNAGIDGYQTYRIPGIVVSKRGVIVAYTSARRTLDLGDWSNIDIVLRRSMDGGRTWDPSRRIAGDSHGTTDNPVAIVDRQTGALHFLFQKELCPLLLHAEHR
jgi:sialidase-1